MPEAKRNPGENLEQQVKHCKEKVQQSFSQNECQTVALKTWANQLKLVDNSLTMVLNHTQSSLEFEELTNRLSELVEAVEDDKDARP